MEARERKIKTTLQTKGTKLGQEKEDPDKIKETDEIPNEIKKKTSIPFYSFILI